MRGRNEDVEFQVTAQLKTKNIKRNIEQEGKIDSGKLRASRRKSSTAIKNETNFCGNFVN